MRRWLTEADWEHVYLTNEELTECDTIGHMRQDAHEGSANKRMTSNKYYEHTIGVLGERAFEKLTGMPMDRKYKSKGDRGIDFRLPIRNQDITIDVKCRKEPEGLELKAKERDQWAKVFVLAKYVRPNRVIFMGWEVKSIMIMIPATRSKYKNTFSKWNHCKPWKFLRPMKTLLSIIANHYETPFKTIISNAIRQDEYGTDGR